MYFLLHPQYIQVRYGSKFGWYILQSFWIYVYLHPEMFLKEIIRKECYCFRIFVLFFKPSRYILFISLIIQGCPDTLTMRFTAKPYILWKGLFHRICSKFYKVKHGHDFFWPPASWRLVEAKNTSRRPKNAWRSQFMEKSV